MFRAAAAAALRNKQRTEEKRERIRKAKENKLLGIPSNVVGFNAEENIRTPLGESFGDSDQEYEAPRDRASFNLKDGFRIKISEVLRRKEHSVYYKDNDERFPEQYTLKLRKEGKYKISIQVDEGIQVLYVKLGGILWDEFQVEPKADNKVGHSFIWDTKKMDLTGNHYRLAFPSVVKLEDQEEIGFDLLLKFYKKDQANYAKGATLSHISLDCSESVDRQDNRNIYKLLYHQVIYK